MLDPDKLKEYIVAGRDISTKAFIESTGGGVHIGDPYWLGRREVYKMILSRWENGDFDA